MCSYVESEDSSRERAVSHHLSPGVEPRSTDLQRVPLPAESALGADTCHSASDAEECTGRVDVFHLLLKNVVWPPE